jgi:hypothetical protein
MITKELVEYIKGELTRGIPRDTLSRVLISNGWNKKDIEEAFTLIKPTKLAPLEPIQPKENRVPIEKIQNEAPVFTADDLEKNPFLVKNTVKDYVWQPTIEAKKGDKQKIIQKEPTTKKKTGVVKIILIIVGIMILVAGGVYAYLKYSNYAENLLRGSGTSTSIKSFQFKLQAEIQQGSRKGILASSAVLADADSFRLSVDGAVDAHDNENPASLVAASVSAPALFDVPVIFEMRYTDGIFYMRVPDTNLMDIFISKDAKPETDAWISFSENDAGSLQKEKPALGDLVAVSRTVPKELFGTSSLGDLKDQLWKGNVVKDFSFKGTEVIDGISTYKINFSVDTLALEKMLAQIAMTRQDQSGILAIAKMFEGLSIPTGTAWIGAEDHLIHKITFTTVAEDGEKNKTVSQFAITLSDFNKNIRIDPPSPSLSAVELLNSVEKSKGKERTRQLLSAASFTAEVYARAHAGFSGLCTSPQGLRDLTNDIAKGDTTLPAPVCRSAKATWIIFAPYGSTDSYWCLDSNGANEEIHVKPLKMSCK